MRLMPTVESSDVPMAPSFGSLEIGSIPALPSMDMSFSSETETQQTSKEST